MSVSLQPASKHLFSRSTRSGRGTRLGRGGGINILVANIGADILKLIIHLPYLQGIEQRKQKEPGGT